MNDHSNLRARLKNGERVIGTFVKINNMDVVEILGRAGFDFIIIDTEHANFSNGEVLNLIRTADSVGMSSVVRVSAAEEAPILHALDSGADGVQIPGISGIEQAVEVCAMTKYCPEGTRGLSLTQRSAGYGIWQKEQKYTDYANEHSLVAVHVENVAVAEQIEDLCDIPQIDVIFVGPADLSQSMGIPGQLDHPDLAVLIEKVFKMALQKGKAVGIFCGNPGAVEKYTAMGATYILYSSDTTMFYRAAVAAKQSLPQA